MHKNIDKFQRDAVSHDTTKTFIVAQAFENHNNLLVCKVPQDYTKINTHILLSNKYSFGVLLSMALCKILNFYRPTDIYHCLARWFYE